MLERYSDGLKQAASRAGEFYRSPAETRPQLFIDFLQGIKVAAGSSHQLAHYQENSKWLDIRDKLEQIIEIGKSFPPSQGRNNIWLKVKTLLEMMEQTGRKIGSSKSMNRTELLMNMNDREMSARVTESIQASKLILPPHG